MITYSLRSSNLVARPHISHRGVPVVASETLVALIRVMMAKRMNTMLITIANGDDDDGDHLGSLVGVGVEEAADDKVDLAADEQNQQQLLHLVRWWFSGKNTLLVRRKTYFGYYD